jgi:hypothetical protein
VFIGSSIRISPKYEKKQAVRRHHTAQQPCSVEMC